MSGQWWQETDPEDADRLGLASEAAGRLPLVYDAHNSSTPTSLAQGERGSAAEGFAQESPAVPEGTTGFTWAKFRESWLYIQLLLAVGLVTVAGLAAHLPIAPAGKVREALAWTVTYDYDFAAHATNSAVWARERGGWVPATQALWSTATGRIRSWAARFSSTGVRTSEAAKDGTLLIPVPGKVLYGFGWLPLTVSHEIHYGLDLAARQGTPVTAMADGKVLRTSVDPVLGTLVEVDHGSVVALYAQVDRITVRQGMQVKRGQQLAVVGQPQGGEKGRESHLHLEVRPAGSAVQVDPTRYLGLGGS